MSGDNPFDFGLRWIIDAYESVGDEEVCGTCGHDIEAHHDRSRPHESIPGAIEQLAACVACPDGPLHVFCVVRVQWASPR